MLHRYIENAPELENDITVYRGFRNTGNRTFEVGQEVEMRGFASTSFHPKVAADFAGGRPDTSRVQLFEIKTRRGLVLGERSAASDTEHETILNHGWKYRVTGVRMAKVQGTVYKVARLEEIRARRGAVLYTEGDIEMSVLEFDPDQPRDDEGRWTGDVAVASERYPRADLKSRPGAEVYSGRVGEYEVQTDVPNTGSISSTFNEDEYEVLPGIREVELKDWNISEKDYYASNDRVRTKELAEALKLSKSLKPLIVVADRDDDDYILEGGHRSRAAKLAGMTKVPAVVVVKYSAKKRGAEFDPDQPRDEDGKWTGGAGEGGGEPDLGELQYDESDASAAMANSHREYLEKIEEAEEYKNREFEGMNEAITEYTGAGASRWNAILRENPDAMDDDDEPRDEDDDSPFVADVTKKWMRDFDDAIAGAPKLKDPVTVYRGISHELNAKAGDTLTMRGFQSASMKPEIAARFSAGGSILKIRTKRGLYIGGNSRGGEDEFVMGHNERFEVKRVSKGKVGGKIVRVYEVEHR
jgi:hypothetical protein